MCSSWGFLAACFARIEKTSPDVVRKNRGNHRIGPLTSRKRFLIFVKVLQGISFHAMRRATPRTPATAVAAARAATSTGGARHRGDRNSKQIKTNKSCLTMFDLDRYRRLIIEIIDHDKS